MNMNNTKEISKDKYEISAPQRPSCSSKESMQEHESPMLSGLSTFDQAQGNLVSPQDPVPSTSISASGAERKDGVTLSEAIKSSGKKPVTKDSFAEYMRRKFGITSIENLISSRSVTRSGKEYGGYPAKELPKKKRSAPPSTETPTPKREPAKRKPAAVPLSNALKNAKPKKKQVVHVPGHTCSKAQMEKDQ